MSLFLSMSSDHSENLSLWNEIYGCVKYLNISYETIMKMPTYVRKFWIKKNNQEYEEKVSKENGMPSNSNSVGINAYAKLEQDKLKTSK